jgi:hypothetical protein
VLISRKTEADKVSGQGAETEAEDELGSKTELNSNSLSGLPWLRDLDGVA